MNNHYRRNLHTKTKEKERKKYGDKDAWNKYIMNLRRNEEKEKQRKKNRRQK